MRQQQKLAIGFNWESERVDSVAKEGEHSTILIRSAFSPITYGSCVNTHSVKLEKDVLNVAVLLATLDVPPWRDSNILSSLFLLRSDVSVRHKLTIATFGFSSCLWNSGWTCCWAPAHENQTLPTLFHDPSDPTYILMSFNDNIV